MTEYESGENTEQQTVVGWEERLALLVMEEWEKADDYSSDLDDLYEDLYLMLRGERTDRQYDWQSNLVINKTFQIVWTAIPYLTQKIFGASPVIGIDSSDKEGSWQREKILEFWYTMQGTTCTPYFTIVVMWVLRAVLSGTGILKKTWHQKMQRKTLKKQVGNETISRSMSIPVEDWPHNEVVNTKDIRWDWMLKPGETIRKGRFITHRTTADLDSLYDSGLYYNLDKLDPNVSIGGSKIVQDHANVTGKDDMEVPPDSDVYADIEIYERQGILHVYKEKEDGKYVPCFDKADAYNNDDVIAKEMVTTLARRQGGAGADIIIRQQVNPYGEKGYIDIQIYLDPERWQATGMVEPVKDLIEGLNDNINASFDEIWQNLMPPVVVDKTALWDWDTMVYAPQQRWLVAGNPAQSIMFKEPSNITRDAWQKHQLLSNEIDITSSVTPASQGVGKEKTATTNVLNAQMSAGKMDFILKMIEITGLIPSAQMDIRFARKFAHPLTFQKILGEPFRFNDIGEEIYQYIPAASSVKLELEKNQEIQEDIQMLQVIGSVPNPNTAMMMNVFLANIMRNRNMPKMAKMLDEGYFEPKTDVGQMERLNQMSPGAPSNQNAIPMSGPEQGVRQATFAPKGLIQ